MAQQSDGGSDSGALNLQVFKANFGGYVLATIVVLAAYSIVDTLAPQYATPLAMITLLGIVLFYFRKG